MMNPVDSAKEVYQVTPKRVVFDGYSCGCTEGSRNDIEEVNCAKIALCRCKQSKSFPLCDRTHEVFNRETNSNMEPVLIEVNGNNVVVNRKKKRNSFTNLSSSTENTNIPSTLQTQSEAVPKEQISDDSKNIQSKTEKKEPMKVGPRIKVDKSKIKAVFTAEEVAKHCTQEDCWMIVHGKVYDITAYFPEHPGGTRALIKFAGRDGTENVQFHSSKMMEILDSYFYIGKLAGAKEDSKCVIS